MGGDSGVGGDKTKNMVMPEFLKLLVELSSRTGFLTPRARLAFTKLSQAFIKAPILHYFDPKCHTRIQTNILGHGGILS